MSTYTVLNTLDSGAGSLRQAILNANANPGLDTINFNIDGGGVKTITPLSPLPTITDPVVIDGTTQPGFAGTPIIELNGSSAGTTSTINGLKITAGNSTVRGLVINRFGGDAILLTTAGGNAIEGNYLGTDVTGTIALANLLGVQVFDGSTGNRIGTNGDGVNDAGERNLISGNKDSGVQLTSQNIVAGNYIGTDVTGTKPLGNGQHGVFITGAANRIGTNGDGVADAAERNLISANTFDGIITSGSAAVQNNIAGNYIGTDVTGTLALPNKLDGVLLTTSGNRIGVNSAHPDYAAEGNRISGNSGAGVEVSGTTATQNVVAGNYIGTDVTGTKALANNNRGVLIINGASANLIGTNGDGVADAAERNLISGNNVDAGVFLGSPNNIVAGNYIGTDVTGTLALPNSGSGILLDTASATGNRIGINGTDPDWPAERNLISGNGSHTFDAGIDITGGASGNVIAGNYIGTDVTGTRALGNKGYGVEIANSNANRIGTDGDGMADAAERNLISGNGGGVFITNSSQNVVAGNYIGTDVTGTLALGNGDFGVQIWTASANRVGINSADVDYPAERNLISGNARTGVAISLAGSTQNVVAGNYIGTDITGTVALPNGGNGVLINSGASANLIGTNGDGVADAAERNLISGNGGAGVNLGTSGGASQNMVAGNYIGTDVTGTKALGNKGDGVLISNSSLTTNSTANRIGTNGTDVDAAGERNLISGNGGAGVDITSNLTTQNVVAGNYIGTDVTGTVALANSGNGVTIATGAQNNQIGGVGALANMITFNAGIGVAVTGNTTTGNSIRGNAIYANTGLGIDLGANGVTANHVGAAVGPNNFQNYPLLGTALPGSTTQVSGTLNSLANTTYTLDFYANPTADSSGHGQGQYYLGAAMVITDASGNVSFSVSVGASTASQVISATATDPNGNTSEFSGDIVSVSPTAIGAVMASGLYGGSASLSATLTAGSSPLSGKTLTFTLNSVVVGTATTNASGVATLSGVSLGSLNAGTYTGYVAASFAGDAVYGASSGTGALTVTPAPLTVSANNASMIYGTTLPAFTVSYSGFVNSDTAASLGGSLSFSTSATSSSPVGSYPVTPSGLTSSNYTITFVSGTLSVTPAPLTVTANNTSMVYGAALPAFTASYNGFVNGDSPGSLSGTLSISTPATSASPVGSYAITPSGLTATNYSITFVSGTLSITPAPLMVTANNASMVYGAALPMFSASYSGFVNGDGPASLGGTLSLSTPATSASPVGSYAITPSGLTATNYNITFVSGTLTITPAPLTVMATNASMVYGGTLPAFTVSYSGFVNNDTAGSLGGSLSFSTSATSSSPVGSYPVIPGGLTSSNYTITFVAGTLTITPAPLTVTANNASMVYGAALPAFTAGYSGFVNGDGPGSLSGTLSIGTLATSASPVGSYAITPSGLTSANYTITFVSGTLSITPAPLTVAANNQARNYGIANPPLTVGYSGFVNGDGPASLGVSLSVTTPATLASAPGSYPITASGLTSSNYSITYVGGTLTITPTPLSATGVGITATAGAQFSGVVATFSNADPFGTTASYTATITWGDRATTSGIITANGSTFSVAGSHTYAAAGSYAVSVRIIHVLGYTTPAITGSTATVTNLGIGIQTGQTATIGFWQSKNGQALITSFNGGSSATALATWLAATFPNLYGANAGANNLTGKSNAQVAAFFLTLFNGTAPKLDAQVLATALNVYATTLSLGGTAAQAYGFTVTAAGLGASSDSVGSSGAAFGVANNTTLNVYQMLQAANAQAVNGVLYNDNQALRDQAIVVFNDVNEDGDIG